MSNRRSNNFLSVMHSPIESSCGHACPLCRHADASAGYISWYEGSAGGTELSLAAACPADSIFSGSKLVLATDYTCAGECGNSRYDKERTCPLSPLCN